jgi:hypothetical protein
MIIFCCYPSFSTTFKKSLSSNFFRKTLLQFFPHRFEFIIKSAFLLPKFFYTYFSSSSYSTFCKHAVDFDSIINFLTKRRNVTGCKGFLNIKKLFSGDKKLQDPSHDIVSLSATILHPSQSSPSPNNYTPYPTDLIFCVCVFCIF